MAGWFIVLYGILILAGYVIPNPANTYINTWFVDEYYVGNIFERARTQLKNSNTCNVILIIQFTLSNLFAHI